jgi:hypothetical protein
VEYPDVLVTRCDQPLALSIKSLKKLKLKKLLSLRSGRFLKAEQNIQWKMTQFIDDAIILVLDIVISLIPSPQT